MALPFVIVPAVNLKSSVVISLFIFAATIPCAVIAPLIKDKIKSVYALPFYCTIAMIIVTVCRLNLGSHAVMLEELGIYVWLTAINSIMVKLSAFEPRANSLKGFKDAVMMCFGFSLACCFVGAAREILGSGTIWDKPLELYPVRLIGVTMPFFGFIMIGFVNAFFRSINRAALRGMLTAPSHEVRKQKKKESVGDKA